MTPRALAPILLCLAVLPFPAAAGEAPPCSVSPCGAVAAASDCLGRGVATAAGVSGVPGDWRFVVEAGDFFGATTYRHEREWRDDTQAAFADYAMPGVTWVHAALYYEDRLLDEEWLGCIGP